MTPSVRFHDVPLRAFVKSGPGVPLTRRDRGFHGHKEFRIGPVLAMPSQISVR